MQAYGGHRTLIVACNVIALVKAQQKHEFWIRQIRQISELSSRVLFTLR